MRLSEDKISHISHLLIDGVQKEGLVAFEDRARILKVTKETLTHYSRMDDEADRAVRQKLATYSRNIQEFSREWDVMYKKLFEEEMRKRWR
ncbi:MAG: DUF507 family protein [Pseudomonadota bacterium]